MWKHIPVVITAPVIGLTVSTFGVLTWTVVGTWIPAPYSFAIAIGFLWVYWKYLSGSWAPARTQEIRSTMCRMRKLSGNAWAIALLATFWIVVAEQSGLVITFRIIPFPAEQFTSEYSFLEQVPAWAAWGCVILISAVAGVCEEVGFRGYMQVPLEKRYGPAGAITIVSTAFVLVHLHQAWSGPVVAHVFLISVMFGVIAYFSKSLLPGILGHFVMDICNFSFWWSTIGSQFDRRPISATGVDIHAVVWLIVFIVGIAGFVDAIRRLRAI